MRHEHILRKESCWLNVAEVSFKLESIGEMLIDPCGDYSIND